MKEMKFFENHLSPQKMREFDEFLTRPGGIFHGGTSQGSGWFIQTTQSGTLKRLRTSCHGTILHCASATNVTATTCP